MLYKKDWENDDICWNWMMDSYMVEHFAIVSSFCVFENFHNKKILKA